MDDNNLELWLPDWRAEFEIVVILYPEYSSWPSWFYLSKAISSICSVYVNVCFGIPVCGEGNQLDNVVAFGCERFEASHRNSTSAFVGGILLLIHDVHSYFIMKGRKNRPKWYLGQADYVSDICQMWGQMFHTSRRKTTVTTSIWQNDLMVHEFWKKCSSLLDPVSQASWSWLPCTMQIEWRNYKPEFPVTEHVGD